MADPDDRPLAERLDEQLMGLGVYLTDVDASGDRLAIEYETVAPGDGVPGRQVGQVLQTIWSVRGEDADPTSVDATVTGDDGELRGTWRAEAEWVERLGDDLSQTEFSRRVLDTVEEPSATP